MSHARLELEDVNYSVHATVLMDAKAGRNAFDIRGDGASPFEVGDTIKVICFERGEVPYTIVRSGHELVGNYPLPTAFSARA